MTEIIWIKKMGKYYKILAHININHEFFAGGTYPSVTLFPLPQTLLFLKNHRIILKQKKKVFFYYKKHPMKQMRLQFLLMNLLCFSE